MTRRLLALVASLSWVAMAQLDGYTLPILHERHYRQRSPAAACCSAVEEAAGLAGCLAREAAAAAAEEEGTASTSPLLVLMATSPGLERAYAGFAEALVADWAVRNALDLRVVVLDDAARIDPPRRPHWCKVPLLARALDEGWPAVLYLDCDTVVVDLGTAWLDRLLVGSRARGHDLVVAREGEGPPELTYVDEEGRGRVNDATFVNTGVLLLRNSEWSQRLLRDWWAVSDQRPAYRTGRTFDQGALGFLLYTHAQDSEWGRHVSVVAPAVLNNHPPGGSFNRSRALPGVEEWWCQHLHPPVLQLAGQSNDARHSVLRRLWRDKCAFPFPLRGALDSPACAALERSETKPPQSEL